jgi:hypothetical protein
LSGKNADQALAILQAKYPGTDFRFFDVAGGSILSNRVLSFFPRGPLEATRTVSQYSQDLVPYTTAVSAGVDQQLGQNVSVSAMFVHRRTRDLLTQRIVNLFDVHPGNANFGKLVHRFPRARQSADRARRVDLLEQQPPRARLRAIEPVGSAHLRRQRPRRRAVRSAPERRCFLAQRHRVQPARHHRQRRRRPG